MNRAIPSLSVTALLALAACSQTDPADETPFDPPLDFEFETADSSWIRVVHGSPDAPSVDVFVGDMQTPAIRGLAFTEGSAYLPVPAGEYGIAVSPSGSPSSEAVLSFDQRFVANNAYTAVAFGSLDSIEGKVVRDDDSLLAPGETRLQVTHAAINVPSVDVWDLQRGIMLADDFDFGATGNLDIPSGEATIGFDLDEDGEPEVSFDVPELADRRINVFALGQERDVFLLAQLEDSSVTEIGPRMAAIRLVHLSPDAPPVDVYLDRQPTPAFEDIAFTEGTAFIQLWAGSYDVAITPAGADPSRSVLQIDGLMLDAEEATTAVAIDYVEQLDAMTLRQGASMIPLPYTMIRFAHAAPDLPEVDIWDSSTGSLLFEDVDFGSSETVVLVSDTYELGVDANDDGEPDLFFTVPDQQTRQLNLFAANDGEEVFLLTQSEDGRMTRVNPR
jgi:hypothetical protein